MANDMRRQAWLRDEARGALTDVDTSGMTTEQMQELVRKRFPPQPSPPVQREQPVERLMSAPEWDEITEGKTTAVRRGGNTIIR